MGALFASARSRLRETAKNHVKLEHRDKLRWFRREVRLERAAIRSGVSPAAVARHRLLGRQDSLRYKGVPVQTLDPATTWDVARDLWSHREYDVPGFIPQPGWRVVDVGANVGLYAMHAGSLGAHVVGFEPHPEAARCARANTARWDVQIREAAVTGQPSDRMTLFISPGRDIRNTLVGTDVNTSDALTEGVEVDTVPLAEALAEPCDLLKVDCEGGEFDIFANGGDALRNAQRVIAEIHLNVGSLDQAVSDLEAAGFNVHVHEPVHDGAPYRQLTAARA